MTTTAQVQRRIARNVRRLRLEQGLTVEEAAEAAKMHWRRWQKIEAGEATGTTLTTICQVAAVLGVAPEELFRPILVRR